MKKLLPRYGGNLCRVEIRDLGVRSGGEVILENITVNIRCGEMTALIGPNGAGKTTFVKALLGQVRHEGRVDHVDAAGKRVQHVRVGYVPQHLDFDRSIPATVLDLMAASLTRRPVFLGVGRGTRKEILAALRTARAEELIGKRLGDLSGGEMQRVLLALALHPMPQLLVLDEPVSGVDVNGMRLFLETVDGLKESSNIAVLLVSHDWELVRQYADRAILLDRTVLEAGTTGQVFSSDAFRQAFPLREGE